MAVDEMCFLTFFIIFFLVDVRILKIIPFAEVLIYLSSIYRSELKGR